MLLREVVVEEDSWFELIASQSSHRDCLGVPGLKRIGQQDSVSEIIIGISQASERRSSSREKCCKKSGFRIFDMDQASTNLLNGGRSEYTKRWHPNARLLYGRNCNGTQVTALN